MGLLLLRATVSLIAIIQGTLTFAYRDGLSIWTGAVGLLLILAGTLLLIGFLTPVAGGLVAIAAISAAYLGSLPPRSLFDATLTTVLVVVVATAVTLLGPGAISADARLFGRREIIIPRAPRSSKH
jgi:uncharacterized membrane protein YphA (DoxX/SURF4 family)